MNWLDVVIIAIVVVGAFIGMKIGLIWTAITAIGAFGGWLLAANLSDDVGNLFNQSLSNASVVTVVTYTVITLVSTLLAALIGRLARPLLSAATMGLAGLVDKLGGVAVGAIVGMALAGALIVAMTQFADNFEVPEAGVAGAVARKIPKVENTREFVKDALAGSAIAPVFIDVTDALPGKILGLVPSDIRTSLNILEQNFQEGTSS